MAIGLVADDGVIAAEVEVTEGTYVAESAAASFIEVLSDGLELSPSRELLERNNRTNTIETIPGRLGQKAMAATVPMELKSGSVATAGHQPESDPFWRALLGARRQRGTNVTTKATAHTASVIEIEDADIADFAVGDIVTIKEAGAFHTSPVTVVDPSGGAANITLLIAAPAGAPSASVVIEQFTTYHHGSGAPTLSLTNYLGGQIREKAIGMRAVTAEIANFATGQLPTASFSMEGLDFDRAVGTPLFTAAFDSSLPPVTLGAKVYKDGVLLDINNLSITLTNTLAFLTSTANKNGKISSRITKFAPTGSFNPYMEDDDVDIFELFRDNTGFSIFAESKNFTNAACTEWNESVGLYIPNCRMPELATGNEDGVLTDAITFAGHSTLGNDSFFLTFA